LALALQVTVLLAQNLEALTLKVLSQSINQSVINELGFEMMKKKIM